MDLLWDGRGVVIAGPDTRAQLYASDRGSLLTGLRFAPGYGPRVLGVPADELTDQHVPLEAVWPLAEVRRITDLLAKQTPDTDVGGDRGFAIAPSQTRTPSSLNASWRWHARTQQHDDRGSDRTQHPSAAAAKHGRVRLWSENLEPNLRMQRALALVRRGFRPADSAARIGYADNLTCLTR